MDVSLCLLNNLRFIQKRLVCFLSVRSHRSLLHGNVFLSVGPDLKVDCYQTELLILHIIIDVIH